MLSLRENGYEFRLYDGSRSHIRPVRSEDKIRIQCGMRLLSDESRFFRFFNQAPELSEEMLEYLTVVDQVNHVAWIAVDPASPAEAGLGIARFIRLVDEPEVAEMALTVVDRYQGKGLGAALLNILLVRAERLSVRTLRAVVLPENYRVIRWMGRIGATSVWRDGLIEVNLAVEGNHVPELEPAIGGKINMPALAVDG